MNKLAQLAIFSATLFAASTAQAIDLRIGLELGFTATAADALGSSRTIENARLGGSLAITPVDFIDLRLGCSRGAAYDAALNDKDGASTLDVCKAGFMVKPSSMKGYGIGYDFAIFGREARRYDDAVYEEARISSRALRLEGPISDAFYWTASIERVERELQIREVNHADTAIVGEERDATAGWGLMGGISLKLGGKK